MKAFRVIIFSVVFFVSTFSGYAQTIEIEAPGEVLEGEVFYLKYTLTIYEDDYINIDLEKNSNFEVVESYRPRQKVTRALLDGRRVTALRTSFLYKIKANKAGNLKLPIATMEVGKKKLKSEKQSISVKKAPSVKDISAFIKVETSKSKVNIEDTLTVTYTLYSTREISKILTLDIPRSREFYSQNITTRRQAVREETIDGVNYFVMELQRLILKPINLGRKSLSEGRVVVEYALPTGRQQRDFWGTVYDEVFRDELSLPVESVTINVQNLIAI